MAKAGCGLVILLAIAGIGFFLLGSGGDSVASPTLPETAVLSVADSDDDPYLDEMLDKDMVRVYRMVDGTAVACRLPLGSEVDVVGSSDQEDGRWYRVSAMGCEGWIPAVMVNGR
jgi:hypothetical protein